MHTSATAWRATLGPIGCLLPTLTQKWSEIQQKGRGQLIYPKAGGEDAGGKGARVAARGGWAAILGAERVIC
ncbi:hypothetical protein P7K49_040184, partial [Saguinus oedipus]